MSAPFPVVIYRVTWWVFRVFSPSLKKLKNPPRKKLLIFLETELSSSNIKTFLIFSYISGKINPKKLLIFWELEILSLPRENFLYFRNQKP